MSHKEMIDLIEHYKWNILCKANRWWIIGDFEGVAEGDTLRDAFFDAYDRQAKWALRRY